MIISTAPMFIISEDIQFIKELQVSSYKLQEVSAVKAETFLLFPGSALSNSLVTTYLSIGLLSEKLES